jgi:type II secretion system protein N
MTALPLPSSKRRRRLARLGGYVAFSLLSLVVGFFLTFPYDALRDRARLEAENAGYVLRLGSLGPGLLGVRAGDVQVSKRSDADPPPGALKLDLVSVGPSLWPPGVKLSVKALGGTITTSLSGLSAVRLKIDAEDLDLSQGNLKGFSGVDFAGNLEGHLDLSLPRAVVGAGASEPDLSQASGTLSLEGKGLTINGGTASITIPQYGNDPTPFDLPRIVLGDLSAHLKVDKGAATVDDFKARSADLEASLGGSLKLGKRVEYSEANLEVRFKPDPEFQKRLGMIGGALAMVPADPKDPSWRLGHLTGLLGRPQFR